MQDQMLSLVSTDELIDEIERRNIAFILGMMRTEEGNKPIITTSFSDNKFIDCLGICSALEEDLKANYMRQKGDDDDDEG